MRAIFTGFLGLLLTLPLPAADRIETFVDQAARQAMATFNLPALSIAIVQDDQVILAKAYGVKESGKPERVSADTLFQIGSTTKAFTTTAMAMLADEKKLDWDDPVRRHLAYFHISDPCADASVTLRDIVSHRSGVSRHDELWDDASFSREETIRRLGEAKLSHPIRTAWQYNNILFIAAGEVVASASKSSWDDFVRTRIFEPLKMTHTQSRFAGWAGSDHAYGHNWSHQTITPHPAAEDTTLGPAGAIKSSANDMAQWLRFQLAGGVIDGKRLVSEAALNETRSPQMALTVDKTARSTNPFTHLQSYAMGWNTQDYRGELLVSHGGAINGFRTQVALLPDRRTGLVIMTNIGRGLGIIALRNILLDSLLHSAPYDWNTTYLGVEKKSDDADAVRRKERESKRLPDAKPSHELSAFTGTYSNRVFGDATVTVDSGALTFRWQRLQIPLTHENYDTFRATSEADDVDEPVRFTLNDEGAIASMDVFGETFTKVQTAPMAHTP